ncbi:peptide ABC transporter substrate-binding protein [Actinomadura sp. NBRC 104412]|uniref:ABC transporter substrate-binding protein n=1 Tax=Actinomadura sp. NBRC 104412 TaxID=3032203 RepID=UPI00249FCB26|nr:ABC transporter substrate-binding protein [Actinomadura sp. NBRC 104412]GLZ08395.1 peptide ABC transporter substrate-binding protein [Actinomadura sp. NBRC 104412]
MLRHIRVLAIVTAAAVTVAGCFGGSVREPASAARTFTYAYNLNIVTEWDPATSYSNEIIAMQNIYESLTRYDAATQKVKPLLATKWTSSGDGTTWTFTLRDGVTFHTGAKLTSTLAKKAIERTMKMEGGAAYIWSPVEKIETPDPRTLVFRLKHAAPMDFIAASDYGAYIYDTAAPGGGSLADHLAKGHDTGSGPYTVGTWNKGQEVELRLQQYKAYWAGWAGAHYTQVEYRVVPEVTTAWQQLRSGDVSFVARLNPQLFAQAKSIKELKTQSTPSFQNLIAFFNTASGPLTDPKVRKAVQAAIDYDGLVSALKGSAVPAEGIVPKGLTGHAPGLARHRDTAAATRLLNEAGYGPGKKALTLDLTYAQGDDNQQTFVTLLSSALKQLNVTLQAKPMQWDAQWSRGKSNDPDERQDIFVMYWFPDYPDAYSWFLNLFRSADPVAFNLTYLDDPKIDGLIDKLPQTTAMDRAAASRSYESLQRTLLVDQAVAAPLYVQQYQRAYQAEIDGYTDNPAYPNVVFVHNLRPTG